MRARDIPNAISIARMLLVLPVAWALLTQQFGLALLLFLVAGISDGLDGFLAKHYGWQSHLGGILDPLADKFLLVSTYLCLGWLGAIPWWLVGLIFLRDLVIVSGAVIYNYRVERFEAAPSLLSKLNTLLQILLALAVVLDLGGYLGLSGWLLQTLVWCVVASTVASGLGYVIEWGRRARARSHHE